MGKWAEQKKNLWYPFRRVW